MDNPFNTQGNNRIARRLIRLSEKTGWSVSALTLAWWRTKPYQVYPLIGCRTLEQFDDSLAALDVDESTLEVLKTIEVSTRGLDS